MSCTREEILDFGVETKFIFKEYEVFRNAMNTEIILVFTESLKKWKNVEVRRVIDSA
jgi:hypothetical protein